MEYKKYQHIERLGTSEVEGILNGKVYLFYKIDGTNSCIFLKRENELGFGSRNREIFIDNDNGGFVNAIHEDKQLYNKLLNYLKKHTNYIIYGEWLIPHTIKRYKSDAWKKFYIFDVYDLENRTYLSFEEYSKDFKEMNIDFIPPIDIVNDPTIEYINEQLNKTGEYLINEGLGEGIVIKNYDYKNKYGRVIWAKILNEDFNEKRKELKLRNYENKISDNIEYNIVKKFITPEFIQKEFEKFKLEKQGFSSKNIFEFLNKTFTEFYRDNWELILKKFKFPIINFKVLKKIVDEEIKQVIL